MLASLRCTRTCLGRRLASSWLRLSPSVALALQHGIPVVALETAIVTHGLPRPHNFQTALAVEAEIRRAGAEPATIGVLNGRVHVGLDVDQLKLLANHPSPQKVSRRDLAPLLADPTAVGGTTVAGTLLAAHAATIPIFATGGIGGVHRGAVTSWDVSADLPELGRTPLCVVCAGVKSILDIPRTLEVLETLGVCVATLGSDFFPAFFAASSGVRSPASLRTTGEAAAVLEAHLRSGMKSGVLLAVPIPAEEAGDGAAVEAAIQTAVEEAEARGVGGREVTPFVLRKVAELTSGASLKANIALVRNNARVAAEVACELARLRNASNPTITTSKPTITTSKPTIMTSKPTITTSKPTITTSKTTVTTSRPTITSPTSSDPAVVVVGGSNVDVVCSAFNLGSEPASYPGAVRQVCGGVGRNLAEVFARLGSPHRLLTATGADAGGRFLRASCPQLSWEAALELSDLRTAHYVALLNANGSLIFGVADMDIHKAVDCAYVRSKAGLLSGASVVLCDANVSAETMREVVVLSSASSVPVWLEATDVLKATTLLDASRAGEAFASINLSEMVAMLKDPRIGSKLSRENWSERLASCGDRSSRREVLVALMRACDALGGHFRGILVKLGPHGALLWPEGRWCTAPQAERIASVSGAGDSFLGAFVWGRYERGLGVEVSLWAGLRAARTSLDTFWPISRRLQPRDFEEEKLAEWARGLDAEEL